MQCPRCNTTLEDGAAFCGNCGAQVSSLQGGNNATVADYSPTIQSIQMRQGEQPAPGAMPPRVERPLEETLLPRSMYYVPQTPQAQAPGTARTPETPSPAQPGPTSPSLKKTRRIAFIVGLVAVLIAAATFGASLVFKSRTPTPTASSPASAASTVGQVTFFDNPNGTPGFTDALKITGNLSNPPSGSQYDAWLINDQNEQITPLGTLVKSGNAFSLNFISGQNGTQQQLNLLGAGNRVEITVEQGTPQEPSGNVVYTAVFPPRAFVHIRHLLFSFPTTPGKIGLLVGLMRQTQALDSQALLLQNFSTSKNTAAVQCVAQSIIDISEGSQGANYRSLSASCSAITTQVGDGFGILGLGGQGYVATAAAHAALAANQTDSTANIKLHAGHVEIATNDIKGWVTTVDQDAVKLLADPANTSAVSEIVTLSDHAFHGVAGPDGQVAPVPGEAGAITGYLHGQFMAILPLVSKS